MGVRVKITLLPNPVGNCARTPLFCSRFSMANIPLVLQIKRNVLLALNRLKCRLHYDDDVTRFTEVLPKHARADP